MIVEKDAYSIVEAMPYYNVSNRQSHYTVASYMYTIKKCTRKLQVRKITYNANFILVNKIIVIHELKEKNIISFTCYSW